MPDLTYTLFATDVALLFVLLAGVIWSIAFPDKRIWPPPSRRSWQWVLTWTCCVSVYGLNLALVFLDWNAWWFSSHLRIVAGIPAALLGGLLVAWGIITLGWTNSAGIKDGFVLAGPYRFTRNPQYVGNIMFFIGLSIVANSLLLWITHALLSLVYVLYPITEERWLEDRYGQAYREYRRATPRYWSRSPAGGDDRGPVDRPPP